MVDLKRNFLDVLSLQSGKWIFAQSFSPYFRSSASGSQLLHYPAWPIEELYQVSRRKQGRLYWCFFLFIQFWGSKVENPILEISTILIDSKRHWKEQTGSSSVFDIPQAPLDFEVARSSRSGPWADACWPELLSSKTPLSKIFFFLACLNSNRKLPKASWIVACDEL